MKQYSLTEFCSPDSPPPCVREIPDVTTELPMTSTDASIAMDHGSKYFEVLGILGLTGAVIAVVAWIGWKIFKYFSGNQDRVTPAIEYFLGDMV